MLAAPTWREGGPVYGIPFLQNCKCTVGRYLVPYPKVRFGGTLLGTLTIMGDADTLTEAALT